MKTFFDLTELKQMLQVWRLASNNIVFTNGCFDILHEGHVTYLEEAKKLGHRLVIGLNTDASVKRLGKGDDRPINNELARAKVLGALRAVDAVVLFDEETPLSLINIVKPEVLVKGADYDENETDDTLKTYIVGANETKKRGGVVKAIPLVQGASTTNTIAKINKANG
jgi:D-beta-D-heptose 7-phosphate kinase/D-beta-D-heptose 1-phosphate adenosyltransferase